jgi:hypothetical protein
VYTRLYTTTIILADPAVALDNSKKRHSATDREPARRLPAPRAKYLDVEIL